MRYDTPVFFQQNSGETYNPETGDYEEGTVKETAVLAAVLPTSQDTLQIVYGGLKEDSLTIHLQNKFNEVFDTIRIGEKIYKVDHKHTLRVKQAFIISEVVGK